MKVLSDYRATATFFLLGRQVDAYPDHAREIVEQGHAPGNHGYSHRPFPSLSRRDLIGEIVTCDEAIHRATGQRPRIVRPPFGLQTAAQQKLLRQAGYESIFWSASGADWKGDPASHIAARALMNARPGAIILFHDGWEPPLDDTMSESERDRFRDRQPTVEALGLVLEELSRQDYRFVSVPELLSHGRPRRVRSFSGD